MEKMSNREMIFAIVALLSGGGVLGATVPKNDTTVTVSKEEFKEFKTSTIRDFKEMKGKLDEQGRILLYLYYTKKDPAKAVLIDGLPITPLVGEIK